MLIILSPAKMMDMSPTPAGLPVTDPEFRNDAELLAAKMRRYSAADLATLLKVSPKLAQENYLRYQNFDDLPRRPSRRFSLMSAAFSNI